MKSWWRYSKSQVERIGPLFHGTVYSFSANNIQFNRDNVIFFSDDRNFAYDYASQKSFDKAMDADIKIIAAYITGRIFNPEEQNDVSEIIGSLPEKITVYNDFGMDSQINKETWKRLISGVHVIPPKFSEEDLVGKQPGDPLPEHEVWKSPMSYELLRITDDYVYYCNRGQIGSVIDGRYASRFDREKQQKFAPKEVADGLIDLSKIEFKKKFNDYLRHYDIFVFKASRKTRTTHGNDTWRWLEGDGVFDAARQCGFDVVKGREDGKNTFAVFPSAKMEIL